MEPKRFYSEEQGARYVFRASKELNYILYQVVHAKDSERKVKAEKKLTNWMKEHPKLSIEFLKKLDKIKKNKSKERNQKP